MTATLSTFFVTWLVAMIVGLCIGCYCCAKDKFGQGEEDEEQVQLT